MSRRGFIGLLIGASVIIGVGLVMDAQRVHMPTLLWALIGALVMGGSVVVAERTAKKPQDPPRD